MPLHHKYFVFVHLLSYGQSPRPAIDNIHIFDLVELGNFRIYLHNSPLTKQNNICWSIRIANVYLILKFFFTKYQYARTNFRFCDNFTIASPSKLLLLTKMCKIYLRFEILIQCVVSQVFVFYPTPRVRCEFPNFCSAPIFYSSKFL
jgi:hypothetical protein